MSIPQSARAPHQAFDKRFYKRFNFESVPMEEYEVRDTSRRSDAPDLSIGFSILSSSIAGPEEMRGACTISLKLNISNAAPTPADYVVINIYLDSRLTLPNGTSELTVVGDATLTANDVEYTCQRLHMNHAIPGKLPIFHGVNFNLLNQPLYALMPEPNSYLVAYDISTPRMPKRLEGMFIVWDGISTTLVSA